jgi:hypothetical protein
MNEKTMSVNKGRGQKWYAGAILYLRPQLEKTVLLVI